jgi:glycosyltransferase involved in cell wall biosynthesis
LIRSLQLGMEWFSETPGGVNRVYGGLVQHLPRAGVEVTGLVTGTTGVSEASHGRVTAVCPTDAPLFTRCRRWRRGIREALARHPEALPAVHFALYALPALDQLSRRRFIVHFHGPWALESLEEGAGRLATHVRAAVEAAVYRRGSAYIVLSEAFGRLLSEKYGVSFDRVRVVPGGVDVASFALPLSRADARRVLGWSSDRPIVLTVRRLVRRMGLENLVTAAAHVRRQTPDALFVIAGVGPLMGELNSRIRTAGLQDTVRLLGPLPDDRLRLAYRAADLTVVPTVSLEGFGMVVPESLAAGTPVLVTPVGGLPEAVAGLSADLVLPETAPTALADAVVQFQRGALRVPSEAHCRAYARERYDWPVVAGQTAAVYREFAR